jgi:DNA-binding NarL/FixJ family response regulator
VDLRIVVVDDHPYVLLGVRSMLKLRAGVTIVGEAATPTALFALFALLLHTPCDVLVTDLPMPEPSGVTKDGLGLVRRIRRDWPRLRIVVMTTLTGTSLLREIVSDSTVSALSKTESMDDLWRAIEASAKGSTYRGRAVIEALPGRRSRRTGRCLRRVCRADRWRWSSGLSADSRSPRSLRRSVAIVARSVVKNAKRCRNLALLAIQVFFCVCARSVF